MVSGYEMRPDEFVLLETACRTMDRIAELDRALEGQPLVVQGSMGQEREHPLLAETRLQRALLNRTLAQLSLPDAGVKVNHQREGGAARWAAAHGH